MPARPTRREVLLASTVALLVVVGAVIAAAVTVGGIPAPSFATDAPVVSAALAAPGQLPGWHPTSSTLLHRSDVLRELSAASPDSQVLHDDRGCAFLDGPTDPSAVTAVATTQFTGGPDEADAALYVEGIAYSSAAPVAADVAAARKPGLEACVGRLLAATAEQDGETSTTKLHALTLRVPLGDAHGIAVSGEWSTGFIGDSSAPPSEIRIEAVLVTASRAEVVIFVENSNGQVSQAVVNTLAQHAAQSLEAHLT